jgi:hypothetical protein
MAGPEVRAGFDKHRGPAFAPRVGLESWALALDAHDPEEARRASAAATIALKRG